MVRQTLRVSLAVLLLACLSGCLGTGHWGEQVGWPTAKQVTRAAKDAVTDPRSWIPVAVAGALVAADVDEQWSQELAEDQPVFGSDAEDISDQLRDASSLAYLVTALAAPSQTVADKARGLSLGLATAAVDGALNGGFKAVTSRERPDGSNDRSLPSGHASIAASRTTLALDNLEHFNLRPWSKATLSWTLHGFAAGTALARVEGERHHLSDVLIGHALGHFVARFMQNAFGGSNAKDSPLTVTPTSTPNGYALTLRLELP